MKNILESLKTAFDSKFIRILTLVVIVLAVMSLTFQAGIFVGYRKAQFSYRMGENYFRTFGGRDEEMRPGDHRFMMNDLTSSHGAIGKIIRIDLPNITVASSDNVEKSVVISSSTMIRRYRDNITIADLRVNDPIMILGSPNDESQIEARFIRVMPEMLATTTSVLASTSVNIQ